MSFQQYSKEILTDYLGTVAYVDDLIFNKKEELKAFNLGNVSTREMAAKTTEEKIVQKENSEGGKAYLEPEVKKEPLSPNINPSAFTNAFLAKGIHCSLFEIKNDDDSLDSLKKILRKSDVVILDWQMHQDDGKKATELLLSVIKSSEKPELRLFVIFTDDPRFSNLLSETIIPKLQEIGISGEIDASGCSFKFGHSKIIILGKTNGEKSETTVSDEELPDRIIEEFIDITSGLVSNTVLKAVSIIRRNSHNLLATFNKELDPAYLAHRAMLPFPEDAELLLKEIIVDSMDFVISYSNTIDACSREKIEDWIDAFNFKDKEIDLATGKAKSIKINVTKEELKRWQKLGYNVFFHESFNTKFGKELLESEFRSFERMKLRKKASDCFFPDNVSLNGQNEEFAILTHHKSNFKTTTYVPYLTLGVVVKKGEDYLLCIQQRCDSLRLMERESRKFLFLPLSEAEGNFPIVFKDDKGEYIIRKVNLSNCHYLLIETFEQTNHGIVEAKKRENSFCFQSIDGSEFKWILDLKESHAQRIANKFAAELSRVGLDESEWLRRSLNV